VQLLNRAAYRSIAGLATEKVAPWTAMANEISIYGPSLSRAVGGSGFSPGLPPAWRAPRRQAVDDGTRRVDGEVRRWRRTTSWIPTTPVIGHPKRAAAVAGAA